MNFTFSDDQLTYRDAVETVLTTEVTPERIRSRWQTDSGVDAALLAQVHELGLITMLVPESLGGLGLDATDFVLLAELCGKVALPENLVDTALVSLPMLVDILDRGLGNRNVQTVLQSVSSGEASIACAHPINPHLNFAVEADWFLVGQGNEVYLLPQSSVTLTSHQSVDPSRRLSSLEFTADPDARVASGSAGAELWRATLNRGALGSAAQLLGLAQGMIERSVSYASDREQFGRAIGANQAVKHLLADCAVQIEYARPVIHRAAYTVAASATRADWAVSHAKAAAARAATLTARQSIQTHGAMGYTWECDLQIWAKRAWVLSREWGDVGFHKNRIHEWLLQPKALLGPEYTFGKRSLIESSQATEI
tara:strand:+ start:4392 stop:5495 length:1104 start_codon:yes stop_codon:yes gene_type:complete